MGIIPAGQKLYRVNRQRDPIGRRDQQNDVKIDPSLMIESDLLAFGGRAVLDRWFRFAMAVRIAASMRLSEHEVLFARDATAPNQSGEQQQRKKRAGQRP